MNKNTRLPGIRRIFRISISKLPDYAVDRAAVKLPVVLPYQPSDVPFVGEASCQCKSTWANNGKAEQVSLKFNSPDAIGTDEGTAWVVQSNDSKLWLIGSKELTAPLLTDTYSSGTPGGDPAVHSYEVTWTAKVALMQCTAAV